MNVRFCVRFLPFASGNQACDFYQQFVLRYAEERRRRAVTFLARAIAKFPAPRMKVAKPDRQTILPKEGARGMATGTSSYRGTVFPVAVARRTNGPKHSLAEIPGLPVFANSGARSWDREFHYNRALGAKAWFLPAEMKANVFDLYWYRENGGIPYQALTARSGNNRPRPTIAVDGGYIISHRSGAHSHVPSSKVGLQTAVLTIPEGNELAEGGSWLTRLVQIDGGDDARGFWRKLALLTRRFRSGGRRAVSG